MKMQVTDNGEKVLYLLPFFVCVIKSKLIKGRMAISTECNFDKCVDFLARMIEKYGNEIDIQESNDSYQDLIISSVNREQSTCHLTNTERM